MDAETVRAISALTMEADADVTRDVTLQNGTSYTFANNPTEHGRQLGQIVMPPRPAGLTVTTLTGFADAVKAGSYSANKNTLLVHVEDYLTVSLKDRSVDPWGQRSTHVQAKHIPTNGFVFDHYYSDLAKFIIGLQVSFLTTDELLFLIRIASNLKAGNTVQTQDDGFSQTVTLRAGEVTTAEVKVQPRIKLIPLRTFAEAAPVESEFLIRFQQTAQQAPSVALFDCEGKKWQGELMQSIKKWLDTQIDPELPIIA